MAVPAASSRWPFGHFLGTTRRCRPSPKPAQQLSFLQVLAPESNILKRQLERSHQVIKITVKST